MSVNTLHRFASEASRKRKATTRRLSFGYEVEVSPDGARTHVDALTMVPKSMGGGFSEPESFDAFRVDARRGLLQMPRFYGLEHFGPPDETLCVDGLPLGGDVRFASTLDPSQQEAQDGVLDALRNGGGCILRRKAGGGKTVIGLSTLFALGRRTIVFSHKTDLLDQWRERIEQHLPGATVGRIQQTRVDVEADVVLATLQSVALRDYDSALFEHFGLAIFDEAHHMGARHFFSVLFKVRPRYLLGLTATPERRDGLTRLLHYGLGPLVTAGTHSETTEKVAVTRIVYRGGAQREARVRGMPCMPLMINDLARDLRRTLVIVAQVARLHASGYHTIVLSDRIAHLHEICTHLTASSVPADAIGFYIASTKAKERTQVRERPVILATFSMAKEGLDIPRLDAEVLATPIGDVEQAVGRIQRPCDHKQPPILIDLVDPFSIFVFTARKRLRFYESKGFDVSHLDA